MIILSRRLFTREICENFILRKFPSIRYVLELCCLSLTPTLMQVRYDLLYISFHVLFYMTNAKISTTVVMCNY